MTTLAQLVWSIVVAAIAVVVASAIALTLIPQLSLAATLRGGTIAFVSMTAVRLVLWMNLRRKQRSADAAEPAASASRHGR